MNYHREQKMDIRMIKLTELSDDGSRGQETFIRIEQLILPPRLSITSKSVQTKTEHRKERSEETNTIEPTALSEAQKTFKQDDGYRSPIMINPSTYDGTSSWLDYKSHFEACASLGHWSE